MATQADAAMMPLTAAVHMRCVLERHALRRCSCQDNTAIHRDGGDGELRLPGLQALRVQQIRHDSLLRTVRSDVGALLKICEAQGTKNSSFSGAHAHAQMCVDCDRALHRDVSAEHERVRAGIHGASANFSRHSGSYL